MNCEEDWEKKRENPHDKSVSYGCKWTSNMSSRRDGDVAVAVSDVGMKMYNKRAKEMGVLPVLKEAKTKKHMRRMEAREADGGKATRVELTKLDWVDGMDKRLTDFCVDESSISESGSSSENNDSTA